MLNIKLKNTLTTPLDISLKVLSSLPPRFQQHVSDSIEIDKKILVDRGVLIETIKTDMSLLELLKSGQNDIKFIRAIIAAHDIDLSAQFKALAIMEFYANGSGVDQKTGIEYFRKQYGELDEDGGRLRQLMDFIYETQNSATEFQDKIDRAERTVGFVTRDFIKAFNQKLIVTKKSLFQLSLSYVYSFRDNEEGTDYIEDREIHKISKPPINSYAPVNCLNYTYKKFTRIPNLIKRFEKLESLIFLYTSIEYFPHWIADLGLKKLEISFTALSEIPLPLFRMTELTHLDLSYNKLTKIPRELSKLDQLIVLKLNCNNIIKLPEFLSTLPLKELSLYFNYKLIADEECIKILEKCLSLEKLLLPKQFKPYKARLKEVLKECDISCI